jgi:hypothetical protein
MTFIKEGPVMFKKTGVGLVALGAIARDCTWYWGLDPVNETHTRLITRVRMRYLWTSPALLFDLLVEFADIVMMRKCLMGIKCRAEQTARPGLPVAA